MVSLRRTKNFATDPQTPMFLYTILKQLDLRSINWNEVAACLGISNGHAARMRYSRMKSQFEGTSNQVKPSKPKKENSNAADNKSSKTKPKNKRLLEEEENERLANQRATSQAVIQPDHDLKRIKVEPHPYMHHPWYSPYGGGTAQMYPTPFWGQSTMSLKPLPHPSFGMPGLPAQNVIPTPPIKTEPGTTSATYTDVETATPAIKQEVDESDVSATIVKKEPGTLLEDRTLPTDVSRDSVSFGYPMPRTIHTFFGPQQSVSTSGQSPSFHNNISEFSTPPSRASYSPFSDHSQCQSASPWSATCAGQNTVTIPTDDAGDKMILNPYAVSYQDMLNMPLYRLYPEPSASQTSHAKAQYVTPQSGVVEARDVEEDKEYNHGHTPPATSTIAPPPPAGSPTTKNNDVGSSTSTSVIPSDTFSSSSESVVHADTSTQPPAIPNIIEVDSDDEGVARPKIKKEFVEM
ncbi:uncharacterized protein Z520_05642 [Fonsecaea multimorphosa CBS 102226]|uniref:Myb-like DNA-binding domain-containing protein n=1 Tax=Fonsecaea multimorphosa CBS 102226 TaxID=1442371 RepID=A0A0D2IMT8_9EURO|nr:uncharacterized protein Z520_05642 [Fonsecaea multimorphosa CBS 102226]KIX98341.1 hypothetical protein Z520_05642 [Fonsecaea multimorphosa CBS 102226]OAL24536.1 hypothetical protein AYO22_05325 [Fonsecaea multimorphosa]